MPSRMGMLAGAEEGLLRSLIAGIEAKVHAGNVDLVIGFQDFDKHNRGVLPLTQFRRVMDRLGTRCACNVIGRDT